MLSQTRLLMKQKKSELILEKLKQGCLSNGPGTLEISVELFCNNRNRLIESLAKKVTGKAVVVLQGGEEVPIYNTGNCYPFLQESFFMWTFGIVEPGCYGVIDLPTKTSYVFIPRYPDSYNIWKGALHVPQDFVKRYLIHRAHYLNEIVPVIMSLQPTVLLTLRGEGEESLEARFPGIDRFPVDNTILYDVIANLRVRKTELEIKVLKYINEISSEAMRKVMRFVKPGKTEQQCEIEFLHFCNSVGGCRHLAFQSVCASNGNAAYTNYSNYYSSKLIEAEDMCLLNMGARYFGYCACIACTFPVNGKFSPKQRLIYEAVLTTSTTVYNQLKPGVSWEDMQILAHRTLLTELKKGGLLRGDIENMVGAGLGSVFHPHGIGHLIGLDVHDVGGFIGVQQSEINICKTLRTTRTLESGMIITLAPGCYFNEYLLHNAMENVVLNRFLQMDTIKKYKDLGGVKIEDDILITKRGPVNLTKLPRTIEEIENWLAGQELLQFN